MLREDGSLQVSSLRKEGLTKQRRACAHARAWLQRHTESVQSFFLCGMALKPRSLLAEG